MIYTINRISESDDGIFGQFLDVDGNMLCVTGELPWLENAPQTSCIPEGTYHCIQHNSPNHPNTWEVTNVPNRSAILIHNGNAPKENSLGCILVGKAFGFIDGLPDVTESVITLNMLRTKLPSEFDLKIINDFN